METIAKHRHARSSAQKVRLVADLIRGKKVSQALETLTYTNKKAAGLVKKVLESAIANAEHNDGADIDDSATACYHGHDGPAPRTDRNLRRCRLHRIAAPARDRNPHGAWSATRRNPVDVRETRIGAGGNRHRHRARRLGRHARMRQRRDASE